MAVEGAYAVALGRKVEQVWDWGTFVCFSHVPNLWAEPCAWRITVPISRKSVQMRLPCEKGTVEAGVL